ncbi:efflux RND transporter periplasmic adaptor subunit [Adhaeribacter rhizoryzae]|uniref:Efflux RND transporter periplasmic adaptor subunit n=1 Tax=Adhaeribacter rhizoryzae TaxID=2607907 RepID=A0A5M6D8U4_9BACT|nr:efflux RND transporter periplasmic adaptor subunit [Adhaeribacter rhizoryzae]KAA5541605.1 efflux RND transporter periplasmic adaptor subunit [Adhaeribacter rhizoryzae]
MKSVLNIYVLAAGLLLGSCGKKESAEVAAAEAPPTATENLTLTQKQFQNIGVALGSPQKVKMGATLQLSGEIDVPPSGLVNVAVPYGGFLRKTSLMPGTRIRKGQVLAVLEHPDYVQLQQDYLDTQTKIQLAELEYARQQELTQEKVAALKNFQQARAELQLLKNNRAGLRQKLLMINIDPAKLSNGGITRYVNILSPINGYVKSVNANLGTMINTSDILFELVNTEDLHLKLNIFEKDITHLRKGQKVNFKLANDPTERTAEIAIIGRTVEQDKTIPVHAHIINPESGLVPGMFVTAAIKTENTEVTALPETAVVQFEGQSFVFVESPNNQFRRVPVTTGIKNGDMIQVTLPAELENSTKIAIKGAHNLLAMQANAEEEE